MSGPKVIFTEPPFSSTVTARFFPSVAAETFCGIFPVEGTSNIARSGTLPYFTKSCANIHFVERVALVAVITLVEGLDDCHALLDHALGDHVRSRLVFEAVHHLIEVVGKIFPIRKSHRPGLPVSGRSRIHGWPNLPASKKPNSPPSTKRSACSGQNPHFSFLCEMDAETEIFIAIKHGDFSSFRR